jgi:hypothetical protein
MNRHERLSRAELGERFRQTAAFRDYAARPKVSFEDSIDEVAVRAEVAKRNQLRAEAKLPLVRFENEVGRLRAIFESDRSAEFNSLTYAMINEVYGKLEPNDFSSLSDMHWFYASKRNVIKRMLSNNEAG